MCKVHVYDDDDDGDDDVSDCGVHPPVSATARSHFSHWTSS